MSFFPQEISKQKQQTLFGAPISTKSNEEQKNNINSSLFRNEKSPIFGPLFNNNVNNEEKNDKKKISQKLYLVLMLKNIYLKFLKQKKVKMI